MFAGQLTTNVKVPALVIVVYYSSVTVYATVLVPISDSVNRSVYVIVKSDVAGLEALCYTDSIA